MWVAAVFVSTHIMSHMLANGQTENYFEFHMAQEHYANSEIKKIILFSFLSINVSVNANYVQQ